MELQDILKAAPERNFFLLAVLQMLWVLSVCSGWVFAAPACRVLRTPP